MSSPRWRTLVESSSWISPLTTKRWVSSKRGAYVKISSAKRTIHGFTISFPVLNLPAFQQLLLRTEKVPANLSLETGEHNLQRADSNSKTISEALQLTLVLYIFKLVLYFNSIIICHQIKYYLEQVHWHRAMSSVIIIKVSRDFKEDLRSNLVKLSNSFFTRWYSHVSLSINRIYDKLLISQEIGKEN